MKRSCFRIPTCSFIRNKSTLGWWHVSFAMLAVVGRTLLADDADAVSTTSMLLLPDNLLSISAIAAQLSSMAYEDSMDFATTTTTTDGDMPSFHHPDFDQLLFFTKEPDQAIFARKDHHCYLAFRGTTTTLNDWQQNLNFATRVIHRSNNRDTGESCRAREGFADFSFLDESSNSSSATQALFQCLSDCPADKKDDCLILTGHSQGGATATVLSIWLVEYSPIVITFGAPMALMEGCTAVPSNSTYRYVNSHANGGSLKLDAVPFLPTPFLSSLTHYGHMLILGPDAEFVAAYMGKHDDRMDDDYDNVRYADLDIAAAHTMRMKNGTLPHSYEGRFWMSSTSSSPMTIMDGFPDGLLCVMDEMCSGGACQFGVCGGDGASLRTLSPTQSPVAAIVEASSTGGGGDSIAAAINVESSSSSSSEKHQGNIISGPLCLEPFIVALLLFICLL